MNIHEYQAKALFKQCGVAILEGILAKNADETANACKELGGKIWVEKHKYTQEVEEREEE